MSAENILSSYLVSLGFQVERSEFAEFEGVLKKASSTVDHYTGFIFADLLKWQIGITGAFTAISAGFLGLADHVAMADQDFRLYGLRMMMTTDTARKLKVSLDALGEPLENVAWDPELRGRFSELIADQAKYQQMLGPSFEGQMRAIRDLRFELTRAHVAMQYFMMLLVSKVFASFGVTIEGIQKKFESWIGYVSEHMPEIADAFATYVTPFLKTTWELLTATGTAVKELAHLFTDLVAVITGDQSLQSESFQFENFAKAIQHVLEFLTFFVKGMIDAERIAVKLTDAVLHLNHALKDLSEIRKLFGMGSGAVIGGTIGTAIEPGVGTLLGTIIGGVAGKINESMMSQQGTAQQITSADASSRASQAYALAIRAGSETGIDPKLIFEEWAHETNNFTSRVARDMNNLGGIKDGLNYRNFGSLAEFEQFYVNVLRESRYQRQGISSATTPEEFAGALKRGGYYEDTYDHYVNGMKRFAGEYASIGSAGKGSQVGSVDQSVTMGDIHIHMPPGSTGDPKEVAKQTRQQVKEELANQYRMALPQLQGAG